MTAEELYREYHSLVRARLRRLGIARKDVDDATQDVFFAVHTSLHTYDGQVPIKHWLMGVTRNTCLQAFRRSQVRARETLQPVEEFSEGACDLSDFESARDANRILHELWPSLTLREQDLALSYLGAENLNDVMREKGCKENPLRMMLRRIRAKARSMKGAQL